MMTTNNDNHHEATANVATNNSAKYNQGKRTVSISTINRSLQDDIKLATCVQNAMKCSFDITAIQETRRTGMGIMTLSDESLKNWQLVWSGHNRKHEHGIGILP